MGCERMAGRLNRLFEYKSSAIVDFARVWEQLDRLMELQMVHGMGSKQGQHEIQILGSGWEEVV